MIIERRLNAFTNSQRRIGRLITQLHGIYFLLTDNISNANNKQITQHGELGENFSGFNQNLRSARQNVARKGKKKNRKRITRLR